MVVTEERALINGHVCERGLAALASADPSHSLTQLPCHPPTQSPWTDTTRDLTTPTHGTRYVSALVELRRKTKSLTPNYPKSRMIR